MKFSCFTLAVAVLFVVGCSTPAATGEVVDPRYDPNNPAVQSNPQPVSAEDARPAEAAPTTYGSVAYGTAPKGVAAPTAYGSSAMTAAAVAAPLVGAWTNQSDPEENIVFTDHSYTSYYEGDMIVEEEMVYHAVCPGGCSGGTSVGIPCFTITSEFGTDCYGILRVTETELELSIIGQSTETVTYTRLP
ncbi:hypothetical protein CEQ90_01340 [Lewinellaceae bacterium SD302]|nr:hypothetical protein CEQ90_01340 [Lewinellaceae bacterium SD302]